MHERGQIERHSIDLLESLDGEWLKLPFAAMRDCGPASQTLGGLLAITTSETFNAVSKIANKARIPTATARKHLAALHAGEWIRNRGRQPLPNGGLCRTATLSITKKTVDAINIEKNRDEEKLVYGVLPWWACNDIRRVGCLPWTAKAVLSVVLADLMKVKGAAEKVGALGDDPAQRWIAIEEFASDYKFKFSLSRLVRITGLCRESAWQGKWLLADLKVIRVYGGKSEKDEYEIDTLWPNPKFRVIVTPTEPGYCSLEFRG